MNDVTDDHEFFECDDICIYCNGLVLIRYNSNYKGYLGYCSICDTQWRVS